MKGGPLGLGSWAWADRTWGIHPWGRGTQMHIGYHASQTERHIGRYSSQTKMLTLSLWKYLPVKT